MQNCLLLQTDKPQVGRINYQYNKARHTKSDSSLLQKQQYSFI